jgi:hypothetical protein
MDVEHLRSMFQILSYNGLAIILEKCEFAVPKQGFLGHRLSAASVKPLNSSGHVMYDFSRPHSVRIAAVLGMVNFYRHFLPKIAQILSPLTDFLKGKDHRWASLPQTVTLHRSRY